MSRVRYAQLPSPRRRIVGRSCRQSYDQGRDSLPRASQPVVLPSTRARCARTQRPPLSTRRAATHTSRSWTAAMARLMPTDARCLRWALRHRRRARCARVARACPAAGGGLTRGRRPTAPHATALRAAGCEARRKGRVAGAWARLVERHAALDAARLTCVPGRLCTALRRRCDAAGCAGRREAHVPQGAPSQRVPSKARRCGVDAPPLNLRRESRFSCGPRRGSTWARPTRRATRQVPAATLSSARRRRARRRRLQCATCLITLQITRC